MIGQMFYTSVMSITTAREVRRVVLRGRWKSRPRAARLPNPVGDHIMDRSSRTSPKQAV